MEVLCSKLADMDAWLTLARDVEPLFGPMADESGFRKALQQAIVENKAFVIRSGSGENTKGIKGGVIISTESNEIAWLAVSQQCRKMGCGRKLLEFAIGRLDRRENIYVQTFDKSVPEGQAARNLYLDIGLVDFKDGGLNPAGIPTVIMQLPGMVDNGT